MGFSPVLIGKTILDVPIIGTISDLKQKNNLNLVLGIGAPQVRKKIYEQLSEYRHHWPSIIHPFAYVDPSVIIGEGSVVFSGAVVQVDSNIGSHVVINTGANVDHDCKIGNFANISPGVSLAGNVRIGEEVFFGINATAIQGTSVGNKSIIGAGAVVINNISENITVVGVPAKMINK